MRGLFHAILLCYGIYPHIGMSYKCSKIKLKKEVIYLFIISDCLLVKLFSRNQLFHIELFFRAIFV